MATRVNDIYANFLDKNAYCKIYLLVLKRPCLKEHFGESLHFLMICQRPDHNFCEGQVLIYRLFVIFKVHCIICL